jgi:hypothetical protein
VNRLSTACAPKAKAACLGKAPTDSVVNLPRYNQYKNYPTPEQAKPVTCSV